MGYLVIERLETAGLRFARSNLHLGESQRVVMSSPRTPRDSVSVRRGHTSQVGAVQVRVVTALVPPSTLVRHCTWTWPAVVVLVWSTELLSEMIRQCVTYCRIYHRELIDLHGGPNNEFIKKIVFKPANEITFLHQVKVSITPFRLY